METPSLKTGQRNLWLQRGDKGLLLQCEVDTYRASGPGGQKRNKTSSAVRLRHLPSGLMVISEDSRSQHENKAWALKRLRREICLGLREKLVEPFVLDALFLPLISPAGISVSVKNEMFFPFCGVILDLFDNQQGRVSQVGILLGMSTAQTSDFLTSEKHLLDQANRIRRRFGHPLLR